MDTERLTWIYTQMLRIREFEERVKRTVEEHPGVIRGHTHLADGAEASIVGALSTLQPGDQLLTTYRCHGYPIVLGTDPNGMMAEIYGRSGGICGGYGGSMHLVDPERGFLGTSGIVGQGIPQAPGAAYAAQIRGQREVVLSFFGDGASKQGAFSESLNVASLWKLPIVYVMENNSYNVVTRVEQEDANAAAGEPLAVKAKGVLDAGRDRRRRRPASRPRCRRAGRRQGSIRPGPDARRIACLPAERPRQHHRPTRRAPALPRARGDRGVREPRRVRGGAAR
jgi:TPP-dependent pyruvate/acetoin dehydrogenase alpha subunit